MNLLESGLIYRNPKPYLRAVNAWHPSLVRLADGELVAAFDLGQGPESLDYRTYLARSSDDGRSWSAPQPLFDDSVQPSTHSVRIGLMPDGGLVGMGTRFHRADPEQGIANRDSNGFVPMDVILLTCADRGRTWEGPRLVVPPLVGPGFELCHPIVELAAGRWLWPTSTLAAWDGAAPSGFKAVAFVSHDRGATWPEYIETFHDEAQLTSFWEQSVAQLPDGRLVAIAWALDNASGAALPTPYRISRDGRGFNPAAPTGFLGQTAKLLPLGGNRLLCTYRRVDETGLWATLAAVEGENWINLATIPLWQGAATGMRGGGVLSDERSALKFGYPTMIKLSDDLVMAAFWCCEDAVFHIRWVKLRIEP